MNLRFIILCLIFLNAGMSLAEGEHPFKRWIGKYTITEKSVCRGLSQVMMDEYNRTFGGDLSMDTCHQISEKFQIDVMSVIAFEIKEIPSQTYIFLLHLSDGRTVTWNIDREAEPSDWTGNPPLRSYWSDGRGYVVTGFYGLEYRTIFEISLNDGRDDIGLFTGENRNDTAKLIFKKLPE